MAQYRMAQWERNYYGALADREEKRRQLVAQEQAANRAANEKKAAEVGMDYDSYTRAMSTKEGAAKIRKARTEGKQAVKQAAPTNAAEKLDSLRGKTAQEQTRSGLTKGTSMSGGQLAKAGAAPMVSMDQLAQNYAQYQMRNFSPLTQEQQNAADSYAKWTKWYSQDAMDEATAASTQQDILRQMGRTTAPTAEELQAAAQAGNASSKSELKKQERDSTVNAMDYGNYALTEAAVTGLEKRKNGQALTEDESAALAEYEDLAARNGQTVEEYLKGAAADYMRAYESSPDFDESQEAYTRMQKGESLSPALDEIRQRQIDKYQGNTGVMEGAEGLLSQGKTGEWMAQWNREYQQAAADYKAQAEQLQLMRASGQASKDAIQTAQDALDATGRKLDELKAVSVLGSQDYGEKSQANAEVYRTDANYWAVNNPDQSRVLTVDEREDMPSELNAGWVSDQERGIYNYLYDTQGQKAANDYLRSVSSRLAYRKAQAQEQEDVQTAQAHPVLASAASIAASPLEIVPSIATGVAALTGQEVSPYSDLFSATRTKNTLRGTVSGNIENPMLNLLYNAGMSMGDNLIAMGATGGAAGLASLQMSASAFGATAYDSMIRGGSTNEAAIAGGASALTEYLTEHMGFDRITKSWTMGKNALGYRGALLQFVKGFIPEGLEEVPGNFVDAAVDGWMMGGQSTRNLRIQELMRDEDMTLDQAMSQADAEFVGDTVMSFLAGGLAGGTMEAGSYVGGVRQGRSAAKADAKAMAQELGVDQKTQQRALEMEYGVRTPDEKALETAREQIETSAEAADHAAFKAQAETDGQAVTVTGMAKSGEGAQVTVKGEDGTEKTVDLAQVTFASDDLRKAYAYASTYGETDTARQFLAGYEMSRDTVDNYRRGFEAAYSEGYTGRKATGGAATWAEGLNPTIRTLAQKAGRAAQERQAGRLLFSEEVDTAVRRAVEAMPRAYTEGYTGVVNRVEGPLTAFESVQMAVADQLGKKFGMVYTIVPRGTDIAAQEGVQGAYTAGTNHAVIALDAQEGMILSVAGHETLHYVKEWTGKNEASRAAYEDFQDFVLEKLQAAEGYDLEVRIAQKQEQYRQAGQELDRAGAMEEIVADGMATVFAREENVRDFLESQDVSLVERVLNVVKRLVKEIRAAIQRLAKRNPEAAAMLKQDADTLQEIADRFDRLGAMAYAIRESEAPSKQGGSESNARDERFSLRDSQGNEVNLSENELEDNKDYVANMEPVVKLFGNPMQKDENGDFYTKGTQYFDSIGNEAKNPVLGKVELNEKGIRHLINRKLTWRKTALLRAVKPVIEQGRILHIANNHNNKDTAIIAATVELDNVPYYMGVVVSQNDELSNTYEVHDAVIVQKQKEGANALTKTPSADSSQTRRGVDEPSIAIILSDLANYNTEFQNKFSLRDVDAQNDEMTRLMQENGELRETVRQLSERLRGTERRVEPAQVRQLARRFKEDTGSRVPLKTIAENMQTAFDAMANARGSGDSQAAMEMMGSIAQDMLEKSDRANRERYDQYAEMRAYFHGGIGLSETQWQEVKKLYGGNAAFRRAIAGLGLKVLPEGSPATLDRSWGEMCEQWPEFFQPDTNEGDQVEAVVAALNAVQVTYENPYGSSLPQYASDLAMLMYEEYLGMPEVKDGQTRQVEKLTRQLSDARAKIREQAAQVRKVGRLEARIQEYKEAAQGRYRRQAQRRKDNQDYAKMRGQVIRQRDQLLKKLREPRLGAFIPQSMNDAVTELMRAIDFEGRLEGYQDKKQRNTLTADALKRAKDAYLALGMPDADGAQGPFAAYVNGDLASDFDLLAETADGKAARDLTMREMEALRNIVAGYTAAVMNEDRLFMQERKESLSAAGEEMAAGMLTRREKMKQGGLAKLGADAARKGLLKPVTVFGQFRGTPMEAAWKALRNAENVHIRNVSRAQEFLEAALKTYGQQESIRTEGSQAKRSRAKTYTTADGRKLQLTDQELMTLYATWKREQLVGTNHLLGGGFTLANAPRGTSTAPIRLAGPDLQEMIDRGLTQQQKDYVDHMVEYLSGQCADWGNEVTMQLYGVEKFHEDYYIPFDVNKKYVPKEPATEQDSRLKTGSFTKALTDKASTPLEIKPFTEVWCAHVEQMSDYNAFVLPIEDMTRMMNYKTEGGERIRALVMRYYSPQTAEYIMNFLSRLNGNSATEAGGSWLNAFMSKAKGAAVTFNLSVAIQQAGSAARAMAEIDPKYFYGGTALAAANLGKRGAAKLTGRSISSSYAELEQYAPIAILKGWGYFDTNMSRGMYQRARSDAMGSISDWRNRDAKENPGMTFTLAREKLYDKASDWGGKLAELGDRATWARIWEAVKLEVADTHPELTKGSEAYFEACAERFTEVIDRTQVVDSVFQRAEWATEKGMMKQQMAFMSEPLTMYNMVYRAVEDLSGANGKAAKAKAGKQLARTLGSITVSSAVTAALKSIVTALRDRDNEKKDEDGNIIGVRTGMDKWLDALGGNFIENMMGIGSIFTNALQSAFSYTSSGDLTTQWMSDLAGALKELQKGSEAELDKAFYKMTRSASALTGIGFGSLVRDVTAIRDASTEYFARDSLAGAAWDKSLPFATRVAAAEKNYVMKKQGDGRKENSEIYYDLMMDAYYTGGFGEDFATVVDAAIRTGGGEGIANSFKTKLREAEERVQMAAQALMDGDMTEYSRLYEELCESAVGRRVVASMINSEYSALQEKEEKEPPTSGSIIAELQRDDVATDPREMAANQAYSAAVEAGSATQLKQAVSALKAAGVDEETLYGKVRTTYKKDYCWAIWSGDRTTAQKASEMMKGAGVGIDNATLKAWTSDLNGSYASDEMYRLMREGDGKQAHLIHKYLVQANSSADMEAKLKKWCKTYVKGGKDEANVRAALKQMGYSQTTIDSWFK